MHFARYWVDYAKRYGGSDKESYRTYDLLEAEWNNIEVTANWLWETAEVKGNNIRYKNAGRILNDLADTLKLFLWFVGRWDERIRLHTQAYHAARALKDWDKAGWHAYDVAWIYYNRIQTGDAAIWVDMCSDAWDREVSK